MVYASAARKTAAYMVLSVVLAISAITFFTGDLGESTTGRVTTTGVTNAVESGSWILFLLGVLVGALVVGTFVYLAHYEHKRDE